MTHATQIQNPTQPAQASCRASEGGQGARRATGITKTMTTENDFRFSLAREFCGYVAPQFVVRFCGLWVGCALTKGEAGELAERFNAARF